MSSLVTAALPSVSGKMTRSGLVTRSSRPPASTVVLALAGMREFYATGELLVCVGSRARRRLRENAPVQRFNVLTGELPLPHERAGHAWRGRREVAEEL